MSKFDAAPPTRAEADLRYLRLDEVQILNPTEANIVATTLAGIAGGGGGTGNVTITTDPDGTTVLVIGDPAASGSGYDGGVEF